MNVYQGILWGIGAITANYALEKYASGFDEPVILRPQSPLVSNCSPLPKNPFEDWYQKLGIFEECQKPYQESP